MTSLRSTFRLVALWAGLVAAAMHGPAAAQAQRSENSGPTGPVPATLPQIRLPDVRDVNIAVPRPVRAAQAALGMGRQRLALVVGMGTVGQRLVVDSAPRDTQAVAAALRSGGFVVMQRNDVSAAELRRGLKEFRERLQPGGVGFVYVTGLGAQIDGRNLLLAREAPLDPAPAEPAALAQQLRDAAVPLDEMADALIGTPDSPRMLVVDAAWKHPVLARLPQAGLAEPRLPTGLMALFGLGLGTVQEVPAVAPLPSPPPTDAVALAATPFARTLVAALLTPRISGPEALRTVRRALADATLGQTSPWLGGDTEAREEFAEASLLDGLIPRTPEEAAREALQRGARLLTRRPAAQAGEQTVAEVLQPARLTPATPPVDDTRAPADNARTLPETPGTASSLGSAVGNAASVLGTVAGVAGTVAGVAATVQAVQVAAAAQVATTAAGTAASVAGNAVALAARAGGGEAPARAAVQQVVAATAAPAAALAAAPVAAPVAAAAPAGAAVAAINPLASAPVAATPAGAGVAAGAGSGAGGAQRLARAGLSNAIEQASGQGEAQQARGPQAPDGRTQRTAEGGERPVYTPRTNPFGYAEGDTFTYQVTDTWKGEVVREYTTAIEEVLSDGRLLANGQQMQMDAQGRLTKLVNANGSVSQFEPAQALWWARPAAGERRIVKYLEKFQGPDHRAAGQTEWTGSARVGRLRKIETPAGEFEVLPVESSGWWYETLADGTRSSGQWSRTAYYAPKLGHPVAIELENADRLGKLLKRERVDLLQAQTRRGTP